MLNRHLENEVFQAALEAVRNNLPMPVDFVINATEKFLAPDVRVDRTLQFNLFGKEILFCVQIKTNVTKALVGHLLILKNKLPYPLLLATNHVTGYMADQLKQNQIEFIDTAGNAFITQPPIYIFAKGNKPPDVFRQVPHKQAFRPTGLRVVFAFLRNPDLVKKPYREIAAIADVALGNIGWIIRHLKDLGYMFDMGKRGLKLTEREKLLNRWVTEYPEKLRPKLLLGRFRGDPDWWKEKNLNYEYAQWGAEVAAAKLTQFLKPQNITIYVRQTHLSNFLIENKLKKDNNGEIEILKRFWKPIGENENKDIVHPILIYADLVATGNQRNIETAKVIFERYVIRYIRED